jgi:hypothetical protein
MPTRFPFRFDSACRRLARLFGVTPERAWVELGEEELEARYGPWRARTGSRSGEQLDYQVFVWAGQGSNLRPWD